MKHALLTPLVLCADFANGLFALLLAAYLTQTTIEWWFIPLALLLAQAPDIDALPELFKRGNVAASATHPYDHREGLHYPLVVLPLVAVLAYYFSFWGMVALVAFTLHYINDFYGTGWGVKLFWPLSKKNYKLLGRRVNRLKYLLIESGDWKNLSVDERRLRLVVSWDREELPSYISRWGLDEWMSSIILVLIGFQELNMACSS